MHNHGSVPKKGILAALWLPTDASGNLLHAELAAHIEFLKRAGVYGILALGSTGEFPFMDVNQRKRALTVVAELAAPLPVIANISDINPRVVSELGRTARELGLPAVAIMPPGFFPSTQDDALAHFLNAAESSQLPTFLYNFPELIGTRIAIETVAAFADRANMAGIKQSGGEFAYHKELIALGREKNFVVFSGADTRLPEVFGLGAAGCIGGIVNIAPELMVQIYRICHEGAAGDVSVPFTRMQEIGKIIDRLPFSLNVAAGVQARGYSPGVLKQAVSPRSAELSAGIVRDLRAKFAEWNLPLGPYAS
ncbi:MAG: dihydrodipicolinate synthase family protein [Magnetospirillum sp.]|nr:dihydrodipicolinate synthase family protein [Magnetospirillum sp.]